MSYVFALSKPPKDVLTITDPNDFIFHSDYDTLKYYVSGSRTVTVPENENEFSQEYVIVTHNLGYRPFFVAFIREYALERYYNAPYYDAEWWGYIGFYVYSTTTQIILRTEMSNNIEDFDFTVWYKIFRNDTGL